MAELGWRRGRCTDQKPGLSWLCEVTGPCTAGVARGEVGDIVDATDRLQVVRGTVAILVALGCQVRLKDLVTRTTSRTHQNKQYITKYFIVCVYFCGLARKRGRQREKGWNREWEQERARGRERLHEVNLFEPEPKVNKRDEHHISSPSLQNLVSSKL